MVEVVRMPKVAEDMQECLIIAWVACEGQQVAEGDVLFELETDKATMEVESVVSGILQRIIVAEGQNAKVDQTVAYIADSTEELDAFLRD